MMARYLGPWQDVRRRDEGRRVRWALALAILGGLLAGWLTAPWGFIPR
jgi:hypothetical protein